MSRIKYYNVYDTMTGELIMKNAMAIEIENQLGLTRNNVSVYAKNNGTFKGRFKFIETGELDSSMSLAMTDWDRTVSVFKRVKWVKSDGKKLKIDK